MKSTRCPEKALAPLYHKPLIYRLHERVQKAQIPEEVVWCTSTNRQDWVLADMATAEDIPVIQGDELDVMSRFLLAADHFGADHIVRVTGDNPLTDPDLIDVMCLHHKATLADYTYCTGFPQGTKPEIIRVEALRDYYETLSQEKRDNTEYMTYDLRELPRQEEIKGVIDYSHIRLTVDTPEDLELVQRIYNHYEGYPPGTGEIIEWYKQHAFHA